MVAGYRFVPVRTLEVAAITTPALRRSEMRIIGCDLHVGYSEM